MRVRPKARIKLGKALVGDPPWRSMPHGVVVYRECDPVDGVNYYWEEWELLGYENTDYWVEYDHYTREVTLYWPVPLQEDVDPEQLRAGQALEIVTGRERHMVTVHEAGVGIIDSLKGGFTYDLQLEQPVAYAELRGEGTEFSLEKFDDRVIDCYRAERLDRAKQKAHFGRVITPRPWRQIIWFALAAVIVGSSVFTSCAPRTETYCTPRTVVQTPNDDPVVSQTETQTCYRRTVFGIGGFGK